MAIPKKLLGVFKWFVRQSAWLVLLISLGLIVGGLAIYFFDTGTNLDLGSHPLKESSVLYDRTGTVPLYTIYGEENRHVIPHAEIPLIMRQATIASEDAHFYNHPGVDVMAILRAAFVNVERNEIQQGASTITQQLARSLFLTREKTWVRKVREIILAIRIESQLTKDQILDLYLNDIPYGSNAYGVEAAAQTFFGKSAKNLSLDEAVVLAALPNAPSLLSPYNGSREELIKRKDNILDKMYSLGFITQSDRDAAKGEKTLAKIAPLERKIIAPHFVFYVRKKLEDLYGNDRLESDGLKIITTIDLGLEKKAEEILAAGVKKNLARGATNGALVMIDPKTGDVLAMVGSRDYFDTTIDGQVNVAIQNRQPGSSFKPFVYATAFTEGFQPETPIYDVPINFGPDGSGKDYIPNDYDGQFRGRLIMRESLAQSLNIPAVTTLYLAGLQNTIDLATRMGITTLTDPKRYGLALALGGAEVKLVDMVSAFGVFGQEGIRHPAEAIVSVMDRDGQNLSPRNTTGQAVLDPEVARKINSILSDNKARTPIFGPKSPLAYPDGGVAAKTGTTQNFRDAWTVGYTTSVAVGVWAGNNDNAPMNDGSDGVFTAAPIWRAFMDSVLPDYPPTPFSPYTPVVKAEEALAPLDVAPVLVYIDKKTGREISPEKAKKRGKNKVDVFYNTPAGQIPAEREDGHYAYTPHSIQDLNAIYFPNGR